MIYQLKAHDFVYNHDDPNSLRKEVVLVLLSYILFMMNIRETVAKEVARLAIPLLYYFKH